MATYVTGRMVQEQSITLNDLTQSSGPLMFRNKIINGNFDIWQRGTSFGVTATNTYTADRWVIVYDGTGATRTITRQSFTLGQTDVPNEPTYFLKWNQSVAGTTGTYNAFVQRLESVRTFANKQITVSFYAKAASAITVAVYGQQWFGTGGSPGPSSATYTNVPTINVTTSWQKFTVNLTVPSIADKNLGNNNDDSFDVVFALPLNTTFTFDIAQVQVEEGTAATPFELRPIGMELQLCQRYYEEIYFVLHRLSTSGAFGGVQPLIYPYKAFKRKVPTGTFYTSGGRTGTINSAIKNGTVTVNVTDSNVLSRDNQNPAHFIVWGGSIMPNVGDYCSGFVTLDAEL